MPLNDPDKGAYAPLGWLVTSRGAQTPPNSPDKGTCSPLEHPSRALGWLAASRGA
jgi:hypothetical protein